MPELVNNNSQPFPWSDFARVCVIGFKPGQRKRLEVASKAFSKACEGVENTEILIKRFRILTEKLESDLLSSSQIYEIKKSHLCILDELQKRRTTKAPRNQK